jgi:hypothetical protein
LTSIRFDVSPGANDSVPDADWKSAGVVALAGAVLYATLTVAVHGWDSVTAIVACVGPLLPSVTVTSGIEIAGAATKVRSTEMVEMAVR